jgi:prolyl-tRNA editing enzyme YbaK/EbsC (Cys-tRNA(Pro) deacylase)
MSLESVRALFAEKAPDIAVIESSISSATVTLAAEVYGVELGEIAKTLSLRVSERVGLIVTSGNLLHLSPCKCACSGRSVSAAGTLQSQAHRRCSILRARTFFPACRRSRQWRRYSLRRGG